MTSAGALVRDARMRAGMTQQQLAAAAGLSQPNIAAYENGRRQPTLPMLHRLLAAASHVLVTDVRSTGGPGRRLRDCIDEVVAACAKHGARNPRVFGSIARFEDDEHSDIDLLVDLDEDRDLLDVAACEIELESLLRAKVDVVPTGALSGAVGDEIRDGAVGL